MRVAIADLHLARLYVVYPGTVRYVIAEGIEALGLDAALEELRGLGGRAPAAVE